MVMDGGRIELPARRHSEALLFEHDGHVFRLQFGCEAAELTETGAAAPIEIFINAEKVDSAMDALAGDVAILISLLLQHGATAKAIGHALRRNPNNTRTSLVGALVDKVAGFR